MKIGVVSDTHGYFDPRLSLRLDGVDEILHAGDVGSMEVLGYLGAIAPVHAVQGNTDAYPLDFPPTITRHCEGVGIYVMHELPKPQSTLDAWAQAPHLNVKPARHRDRFLESFPADCRVVVFGHSHEPCLDVVAGRLFFNPGSAGKKRFSLPRCCGVLELTPQGVRATILSLERYNNEDLPAEVWLPLGGS
jgi:uncharacterized protein